MTDENLDCLEAIDAFGDALDVLETPDPLIALLDMVVEDIIVDTALDILDNA